MAVTAPTLNEPVPREDEWFDAVNADLTGLDTDRTALLARLPGGAVLLDEIATPSTPAAGKGLVYFKSDGLLYQLDDAGTEKRIAQASGDSLTPSSLGVSGSFRTSGVISPAALSGTTHDWNPTGLAGASLIRVNLGGANRDLTGIVAQEAGRRLILFNAVDSSGPSLTLKFFNTGSSSANRFLTPFDRDFVLAPRSAVELIYSGVDGLWIVQANHPGPKTYTPSWASGGTQPSIGNGTLSGSWQQIGSLLQVSIYLIGGSTTTWGGADWRFGLPSGKTNVAGIRQTLSAIAHDSSDGNRGFVGGARLDPGASEFYVYSHNSYAFSNNAPIVWAVNDFLYISGAIQVTG